LVANARQQLREMIAQNRNHASVAVWGIANEVDFGPNRPGFLNNGTSQVPDPMPLLRNLNALAHSLDAARPTTLATCCEDTGQKDIPSVADITDVSGANRYFGWYYGKADEMGPHLDHLRQRPRQPLSVTEYGGAVRFRCILTTWMRAD
jgi:beta-galactosidase